MGSKMLLKLILLIVMLTFFSFFIGENYNQEVKLTIFGLVIGEKIPAIFLIFISMLMGILLTLPIFLKEKIQVCKEMRRKKKEIKKLKKETAQTTKELNKLSSEKEKEKEQNE